MNSLELVGSLSSEIASIDLNIEAEVAEINVLEPQLAGCITEENIYSEGAGSKMRRKEALESQFETEFHRLTAIEERRRILNDEVDVMRSNLNRAAPDHKDETVHSVRRIQSNDLPKLVAFLQADARKLRDIRSDIESINVKIALSKQRLLEQNRCVRSLIGSSHEAVKLTHRSLEDHCNGFIPIDSMGHKRRREEQRIRELENQKPTLFPGVTEADMLPVVSELHQLSGLVAALSDDETVEQTASASKQASMVDGSLPRIDAFLMNSKVIVLD